MTPAVGLPVHRHPGGWAIVPVHYSMDPDKDPAWAGRERAKYVLQTDWDREMEVDMRAQSGVAAYPHWSDGLHIQADLALMPAVPLCLTCDFNVKPMVWLVCQVFRRVVHVLDEVIGLGQSVPQLMTEFRNRYPSHTQELWVYGDPAGNQRHAQTAMSDYDQMRLGLANYPVPVVWKVAAAHPPVKDRLAAVNQALRDVDGRAWVQVHPRCTSLIADMQEVVLDGQGGIKKTSDQSNPYSQRTHASDALGYLIAREFPVVERVFRQERKRLAPRVYGAVRGAI